MEKEKRMQFLSRAIDRVGAEIERLNNKPGGFSLADYTPEYHKKAGELMKEYDKLTAEFYALRGF